MADLPENPNNREEEYLADMAGEDGTKPNKPWSRKEAYLDAIDGRMDMIDEKIAALATDISLKGGVADYDHLPQDAAVGDAYITEDTGTMYVWVGDQWTALNEGGGNTMVLYTNPGLPDTASSSYHLYSDINLTTTVDTMDIYDHVTAGGSVVLIVPSTMEGTIIWSACVAPLYEINYDRDDALAGVYFLVKENVGNPKLYLYSGSTGDWYGKYNFVSVPTVVQELGSSTTDVMSQKAVTDTIFIDSSHNSIRIGTTNTVATYAVCLGNAAAAQGASSVGIGNNSSSYGVDSVAVGYYAIANGEGNVAIGNNCRSRNSYNNGVIAIGSGIDFNTGGCSGSVLLGAGTGLDGRYGKGIVSFYVKSDNDVNTYGYNGTHYRLIMGVHDPQSAHDAATKGYVDGMHAVLYANSTKLVDSASDLEFYKEASLTTKWTAGDIANLIVNGADITIVVKNPSEDDETARFTLNMLTGHSPKTPTDETLDEVGLDMFAINCQTGTKYRMTSYGPLTETNWSVGSFNL